MILYKKFKLMGDIILINIKKEGGLKRYDSFKEIV
jgi:hypothetical protein